MNPISRLRTRARSDAASVGDRPVVQQVLAFGRRIEQTENRQQRRLPAARRPGDRDVLALADFHVNAREGVRLDLVGVEHLGHTIELQERLSVRRHARCLPQNS